MCVKTEYEINRIRKFHFPHVHVLLVFAFSYFSRVVRYKIDLKKETLHFFLAKFKMKTLHTCSELVRENMLKY